jgi:hypothetical protein
VDVAKYKKVSHLGALEGEDRHARPPHVAAARWHSKQFLAMKTVEPHLAADAIAFLDHRQNVCCVLAERFCYEVGPLCCQGFGSRPRILPARTSLSRVARVPDLVDPEGWRKADRSNLFGLRFHDIRADVDGCITVEQMPSRARETKSGIVSVLCSR